MPTLPCLQTSHTQEGQSIQGPLVSALQVQPRPVLSVMDLQATVIGGENEFGRLESQLLCLQTHLAHLKETEVRTSSGMCCCSHCLHMHFQV